jgi:hypothetical protein
MSYVFISYSHSDSEYARQFSIHLESRRIPFWIDERIDYGAKWPDVIERQLDGCSVFVVIMTPKARLSTWVQNELARAQRKKKKIFPLLLEGDEPWLSVEALQYVDVRGGKLPPDSFFNNLSDSFSHPKRAKKLIYESDFRVASSQWEEAEYPDGKAFRKDNFYHIQVPKGRYERYFYTGYSLSDFSVSVDAQFLPTSDKEAQCGIVFKVAESKLKSKDDYYRFSISRTGMYALHVFSDGEWDTIADYTKSDIVKTSGEFNTLIVQVQESMIELGLNGLPLRNLQDDRLPTGKIGLFVASVTENMLAEARFQNFRLYIL